MNSSKRKGDKAELEVQGILRDLLGVPARRALGAGRKDDVGDVTGVWEMVIQVANKPSDTLRAVREKPLECERQRLRAGVMFGATFVRFRGGGKTPDETAYPNWRVSLTVEQLAALYREAV